jgi:Uma2 family endonuclease
MASSVLIPVSEYLNTTYRPDCDYIDGEVKKRNVGERPHTQLQIILGAIFRQHSAEWRTIAMGDQRVQTSDENYRVADLCVIRETDPYELIIKTPPLLCVEILSRGDTLDELQERVDDYLLMGVENIWAINPWKKLGYVASARGFERVEDGMLRIEGTLIAINLFDVFAELDRTRSR